jgi:hypothetical protein
MNPAKLDSPLHTVALPHAVVVAVGAGAGAFLRPCSEASSDE